MISDDSFVADMVAAAPDVYASHILTRFAPIVGPWRAWRARRAALDAVTRAQRAGVVTPDEVGALVCTHALRRNVWYPQQVARLVAAGLLVDDGPVDRQPECRWYVPA
jgi:hypothetical protein